MSKMKLCKICSKEIVANEKVCPSCGAKNNKPFYKKVWLWAIAFTIVVSVASMGGCSNNSSSSTSSSGSDVTQDQSTTETSEETEEQSVPTEYKNALKKAESYNEMMHMSKAGMYNQLTSEHGAKYSVEAAQYAIDNIKADWKANALQKAKDYQKIMSMSPDAIYNQLISEDGEKFTEEEAKYAVDNLK